MNPGDVVLIPLPQVGGGPPKLRPALLLANLPGPYQDLLLCGISTQLHLLTTDWDEHIAPGAADYATSGLRHASVIRLSYLYAATDTEVAGSIGRISEERLHRLQERLIKRLHS